MISDQIDPIFRRPTFTPRHFGLDREQFFDVSISVFSTVYLFQKIFFQIAIRLVDDRIFILGSLFEKFVEKEEEAVRRRGDGDNNAGGCIST